MGIILHCPPSSRAELARRVAQVHAQAVADKVKTIPCPTEQKLRLMSAVMQMQNREEQA